MATGDGWNYCLFRIQKIVAWPSYWYLRQTVTPWQRSSRNRCDVTFSQSIMTAVTVTVAATHLTDGMYGFLSIY